jgi:acyl carrier protein
MSNSVHEEACAAEETRILAAMRRLMIDYQMIDDAERELTSCTHLIDDFGLDSIKTLELITALEEKFDITIDLDELDMDAELGRRNGPPRQTKDGGPRMRMRERWRHWPNPGVMGSFSAGTRRRATQGLSLGDSKTGSCGCPSSKRSSTARPGVSGGSRPSRARWRAPLEAMACGTPVVASRGGALAEVLGSAALLVDPVDPGGLAGAIVRVLESRSLREELRGRGLNHCRQYDWRRTAEETVAVYDRTVRVAGKQ